MNKRDRVILAAVAKKFTQQNVQARVNERQALEMRLQGYSYADIAVALNIAIDTARETIKRVMFRMAETTAEDAVEVRTLELERLDLMLVRLQEQIAKGSEKAIETALRIQERRSRLLGLDSPKKFELDNKVTLRQYVGVDVDSV